MEKRKPTYDLDAFKSAFSTEDRLSATSSALISASSLGFTRPEIVQAIQSMQRRQFYKSMTSFSNHREWQDVYHVPSLVGTIYIKFRADVVTEFTLLSFKEKDID